MEVEKFLSLMDAIRFDTDLDETNPELRGLARKVYPYIRQIYNMMNEAGLISESVNKKNIISQAVRSTLREFISPNKPSTDYQGNDLNFDSIVDQAVSVIYKMEQNGEDIRWSDVARNMGFRLETLNQEDMELLHDAIEHAMALPGIEESKVNEVHGAKKHNAPKNERAAERKGNRDAELETFGGGFKQKNKIHKPKNDYNRKDNKVDVNNINDNLDESVMKNTVKLNESELQYIVTASVKKILKEDYLGVDGVGKYFDSDDDYITVSIPGSKRELKSVLDEKMKSLGYEFSDSGANGDKIMLTYKRLGL